MLTGVAEDLNIASLQRAYAAGRDVADVIADVMGRIAAYDRKGVWIYVLNEEEINRQLAALSVAKRSGKSLPLYGVPFAVKDNIDVAGVPTTAGCREYAYVPRESATCVKKLCDAGAIVVGKTNLDQFATGLVGTRSPYGACENAFDRAWISGGSSSGSAVAVAGGLVSFALATDTAGSGRVPAALNNLVGLKPTRGVVGATGVVPACRSLDCVAFFAGTCGEARLLQEICAGFDAGDPLSRVGTESKRAPAPSSLRVGIPDALEFFGNREVEALFDKACKRIERTGTTLVPIDFRPFRRTGDLLYNGPWVAERLLAAGNIFRERPDALQPEIRRILQMATKYTAGDAFDGLHTLAGLRREADAQMAGIDVLLTPTTGTTYRIAEVQADPLQLNVNLSYYTTFVNLLDMSALALPCGFLSSGMPMGVTFVAPAFCESMLLDLGETFEHILCPEKVS